MSQPIKVYRVADGQEVTLYAPRYVAELVAAGVYSYEPVMVETPAPVPALTEEAPAIEEETAAPKPQAPARQRQKGQAL